jgi:hypothetical protein
VAALRRIAGGPVFIGEHVELIQYLRQQPTNSVSCPNALFFDFIHFSGLALLAQAVDYPETGFEEIDPVLAIWSCGRGGTGERVGVPRASSHSRIVTRSGATATPAKTSG